MILCVCQKKKNKLSQCIYIPMYVCVCKYIFMYLRFCKSIYISTYYVSICLCTYACIYLCSMYYACMDTRMSIYSFHIKIWISYSNEYICYKCINMHGFTICLLNSSVNELVEICINMITSVKQNTISSVN